MQSSFPPIADRLRKLVDIPLDQVDQYWYNEDLTCEQKGKWALWSPSIPLVGRIQAAIDHPMTHIERLSKALAALETEIRKNDCAILNNPETGTLVARAVTRFRIIVCYEKSKHSESFEIFQARDKLEKKCSAIADLVLSHFPLEVSPDGVKRLPQCLYGEFCQEPKYDAEKKTVALVDPIYARPLEERAFKALYHEVRQLPAESDSPLKGHLLNLRTLCEYNPLDDADRVRFSELYLDRIYELLTLDILSLEQSNELMLYIT